MARNNSRYPWIIGAIGLLAAILGMAWYLNHSEFDDASFLGGAGTSAPAPQLSGKAPTNIAHPRSAPAFELPTPDGKPFALSSLKGNAVLVHFWATWCPPCLGELPRWLEYSAEWKGKKVRFVAVSLDQGWPEALKILPVNHLPEGVVSVLDAQQTLPELFGTYQYPETYLLDSDLRIVSKWVGAQEWNSPEIRQAIEAVLPGS